MISISKMPRASVDAVLVLAGVATIAQRQVPGGGSSFGRSSGGMVLIKGSVICACCSIDEAYKAQPT
jgi:hypothetical protein